MSVYNAVFPEAVYPLGVQVAPEATGVPHIVPHGGFPVVYPRETALDATKQEALDAAHRAHNASLSRAEYEATAYNTAAHARECNQIRYDQAAARDASEMARLGSIMINNRCIANGSLPIGTNPVQAHPHHAPVALHAPPTFYIQQ